MLTTRNVLFIRRQFVWRRLAGFALVLTLRKPRNSGERHTNVPTNNMWTTRMENVKWVKSNVFDLSPCIAREAF